MTETPPPRDRDVPPGTPDPAEAWDGEPLPWPDRARAADASGTADTHGDVPPSFASAGEEGLWRLDHPDSPMPATDPSLADARLGAPAEGPAAQPGSSTAGSVLGPTAADGGTMSATPGAVAPSAASDARASRAAIAGDAGDGGDSVGADPDATGHTASGEEGPVDSLAVGEGPSSAGAAGTGSASPDVDPFVGCRYLVAASGGWRASDAIRDHRCAALDPPSAIAIEKQHRLCLTGAHTTCPTFLAAREERGRALGSVDSGWEPARPIVRTAPVVVGAPQRDRAVTGLLTPARLGEAALGVMAIVVVILLGSRILGGASSPEPSPIAGVDSGATPAATADVGSSATAGSPATGAIASASAGAGDASGSPAPSATGSAAPSARPTAIAKRTYKVKSGDTLTAIAAKYGTTVAAIMRLNKIKDARSIRSGQVLKIP